MSDALVCENWMHFHEINFPSRVGVWGGSSAIFYHQTATRTLVEVLMQVLCLALPLAEKEWLQEEMVMLSGLSSAALSTTIYFEGADVARNNESFQYLVSTEKKKKK